MNDNLYETIVSDVNGAIWCTVLDITEREVEVSVNAAECIHEIINRDVFDPVYNEITFRFKIPLRTELQEGL